MIVAILSLLGATLTLPGIAGIVLTIGMAVDSNVLIYERIREERRNGRSVIQSLDTGFAKALATIVDANVTTLIAAVSAVLPRHWSGQGLRRHARDRHRDDGLHRLHPDALAGRRIWLRRCRPKELPRGLGHASSRPTPRSRSWASAAGPSRCRSSLSIASVVLFFTIDMNYGIDFKGGSIIEVQAKNGNADPADIRGRLSELNIGDVQVQEFGAAARRADPRRPRRTPATAPSSRSSRRFATRCRTTTISAASKSSVRPSPANWPARARSACSSRWSAILIYIWFRFEWQFAVGAIVATVHDVVMTIGFFVVIGHRVQPVVDRGDPDHRRLFARTTRSSSTTASARICDNTRRCRSRSCSNTPSTRRCRERC